MERYNCPSTGSINWRATKVNSIPIARQAGSSVFKSIIERNPIEC